MIVPVNMEEKKNLYMKPVQIMARDMFLDLNEELECLFMHPLEAKMRRKFLEIVKKHGNGLWAFEELEWKIYVDGIDAYEALSEEEQWDLNTYMISFRSLYK